MTRPPPTAPLFPYTTLFRSHSTWPGLLTDVRAFELPRRMLRQGEPETCRIGPRGHVVPVDIVRIRDPESGRRVVGRNQDVLGVLAGRIEVPPAVRLERG